MSLGTVSVLPGVREENNVWPYWRWRSPRTTFGTETFRKL